jgi:phospholipase A1
MRVHIGHGMKSILTNIGVGLLLIGGFSSALAEPALVQLEDCMTIQNNPERLACYDRLAQNNQHATVEPVRDVAVPRPLNKAKDSASGEPPHDNDNASYLASHWELDPAHKRGSFSFRPHHDNYLVATYNPSPNNSPYRPFRSLAPGANGLVHNEVAFQLSFKMKLAENLFNQPVDFWFGYTQRSFWQATNHQASSPFRETDYQPELMAVIPADVDLPGLRMRFVNLGLLHQSNGQGSSLSRSWNRAYAQFGFERGDFTLLARIWKRFNESAGSDNNPNIVDYIGHGDLMTTYRRNGHEFSLLLRRNFHTDKGAAQASWTFPLASNLNGYVQFFSGYGYSLIDYNAMQHVLGLGLLVKFQ